VPESSLSYSEQAEWREQYSTLQPEPEQGVFPAGAVFGILMGVAVIALFVRRRRQASRSESADVGQKSRDFDRRVDIDQMLREGAMLIDCKCAAGHKMEWPDFSGVADTVAAGNAATAGNMATAPGSSAGLVPSITATSAPNRMAAQRP
jgi:hypothetical protein